MRVSACTCGLCMCTYVRACVRARVVVINGHWGPQNEN